MGSLPYAERDGKIPKMWREMKKGGREKNVNRKKEIEISQKI